MLLRNVRVTNQYIKGRFVAAFFVTESALCILGLCLCLAACNRPQERVQYESAQSEWREGDIVLRCGYGFESRAVTQRSRSVYSHVGLLHFDSLSGEWQVVHAVPAEDEPEYVKAEPVSIFFSRERARKGAWLRVKCSDGQARAATTYALRKVADRVLFDNDYSLEDTTQLYCTELVWRAYQTQGIDVSGGGRQEAPMFICKDGEGIFPSHIEKSETTLFVKPF